jgi:FtsH-binding integral membrane protein
MNFYNNNQGYSTRPAEGFMSKVYGWMAGGLGLTALTSYLISPINNPEVFVMLFQSGWMPVVILFVLQIGIVLYFSAAWQQLSYGTLSFLYIAYSILTGLILTPVIFQYTMASVFSTFMITAAMFVVMAIYGRVTKSDLSSLHNILIMGMIGLSIAHVCNMFFRSAGFDLVVACVGVGIFSLLIAYDMQKLKQISHDLIRFPQDIDKVSLLGAMMLYLDILNLFLYLLRIFGEKRRK